jgi:pilus assembly protein Flp/PilA
MKKLKALNERGTTAIEYALIAGLIAIVIVTSMQLVGTRMSVMFNRISNAVDGAVSR